MRRETNQFHLQIVYYRSSTDEHKWRLKRSNLYLPIRPNVFWVAVPVIFEQSFIRSHVFQLIILHGFEARQPTAGIAVFDWRCFICCSLTVLPLTPSSHLSAVISFIQGPGKEYLCHINVLCVRSYSEKSHDLQFQQTFKGLFGMKRMFV